jgi:hypothetical protein
MIVDKGVLLRRFVGALVICAALVGSFASTAAAAPKTLCVGGAHCFHTIRAALAAAHDGDTISIAKGSFAGGVTIDKSVKLIGAGAGATAITGGGPVVVIGTRGAQRQPTVRIQGLTITGGRTRTDPTGTCGPDIPECGPNYARATALAGGIEILPASGAGTTASVTIVESVIRDNRATPTMTVPSVHAPCPGGPCPFAQAAGGGIDNWGTLTLRHTVVRDNLVGGAIVAQADGGGIVDEASARLTLDHSSVSGNRAIASAPNGRYASGGGIYVDSGGVLVIQRSSVGGNESSLSSTYPKSVDSNANTGGIYVADGGSATVDGSSIDRNTVTVSDPNGEPVGYDPAICACAGSTTLVLRNTTVQGNRMVVRVEDSAEGGSGGGLEADGDATIDHVHITHNSTEVVTTSGLAATNAIVNLFDGASKPALLSNSTITANTVTATSATGSVSIKGVGLANNGPLVLRNVTISDNTGTATGPSGSILGGGIFNGLVFPDPSPSLTLHGTTITHNTLTANAAVTVQGSGIYTEGFTATLDGSQIAGNTPDQCFGC